MISGADRRQAARLTVPRRWGGGDLELHLVRLLDLSPRGVRITHREPLHAGGIGYVDLPPALGAVRLTGRLMWTRLRRIAHTPAGDRRPLYESGLEFTSRPPRSGGSRRPWRRKQARPPRIGSRLQRRRLLTPGPDHASLWV
jgi:hypothetical protein